MTTVRFALETSVPAAHVLGAAIEFSKRRPDLWPNISRRFYTVHDVSETWADVTEGSDIMGGFWARERYDWSTPGTVKATVQESNVFQPGGTWEIRVQPVESGGSRIEVTRDRKGRGPKGRVMEALLAVVGRKVLAGGLQRTLEILAHEGGERVRLTSASGTSE